MIRNATGDISLADDGDAGRRRSNVELHPGSTLWHCELHLGSIWRPSSTVVFLSQHRSLVHRVYQCLAVESLLNADLHDGANVNS